MPNLVRVPWEPQVWVERATLDLLVEASRRAGHNIRLSSSAASLKAGEGNGGWRSWDSQNALYIGWIKGWPGYNVASNPDTGLRQHMRGAAVDILNKSDRIHMLAVGFKPDAGEWWHFNHPNWANMPIIRNLAAASLGVTPIGDDLSAEAERQIDALYRYYAPGIAGKHYDGEGLARAKSVEDRVAQLWDKLLPGIEGVKTDGVVYEQTKWTWWVAKDLYAELAKLPGRVWDFELERPTGPANPDGSRPRTRAGDFVRFSQAFVDDLTAKIVASGGKPLTDAQAREIAAIIATRIPQVDEASITTRVMAGVRDMLRKAIA